MKYNNLYVELISAGCEIIRKGANHNIWYSPKTGNTWPIPRHGSHEVPKGTEQKIRKVMGI